MADDDSKPAMVLLAHGAGSHMEHKTLEWLAGLVRESGASVARFNFLYRAQGRSMPDRMPVLMRTYRAVAESIRERFSPQSLVIGGHSMGGRVASMIEAEGRSAEGLLLFGYPLHPAGQPDKLRVAHLSAIETPTLQINGTEDALCTMEIMDRVVPELKRWRLKWIEGADHSYAVKKSSGRGRRDVELEIRGDVTDWLSEILRP